MANLHKNGASAFLTFLLSDELSVYTAHCEEVKKESEEICYFCLLEKISFFFHTMLSGFLPLEIF